MKSNNIIESKETALAQITQLAQKFDISLDEIGAQFTHKNSRDKSGAWLSHLLAYLGGAFVFGGLVLLISILWNDLNSVARVIITYGPGLFSFAFGIFTLKDLRYNKASTPLFLTSAILLPTGIFVFLDEYANGDDTQLAAMIVFGILACQFLGVFFSLQRTSLLFFGYLFWNASVGILMVRAGVSAELLGITLGLSIMMVAWSIDQTKHRAITPFWYCLGSIGLLWSTFDLIEGIPPVDILYLPLTILLMLISTRIHSRTLLFISTSGLLVFLGYYTREYFADVTGWPIALIIMGFLLMGISAYAIRLGKKIQ